MKDFFIKYNYKIRIFDDVIIKNSLFIFYHIMISLIILYDYLSGLKLDIFYFMI